MTYYEACRCSLNATAARDTTSSMWSVVLTEFGTMLTVIRDDKPADYIGDEAEDIARQFDDWRPEDPASAVDLLAQLDED